VSFTFLKKINVAQRQRQRIVVADGAGDFIFKHDLELTVVDETVSPS